MAPISSSFQVILLMCMLMGASSCNLRPNFYKKSCPRLSSTVKSAVKSAVSQEKRMGASLLRLHFHDCFVQGCDASLLLDDTPTFSGEQTANPNNGSIRGLDVIDKIKSKVEGVCPGVVSCADILAIVARDSVLLLGGPTWEVKLGRRDSLSASLAAANSGVIPPPTATVKQLVRRFKDRGLSARDMVVLSGAHTIGQARCTVFRGRIYNETNIDPSFAQTRRRNCPRATGDGDNNLAHFDVKTPNMFDNVYYTNLIVEKGLLHSDQILHDDASTKSLVEFYNKNPKAFSKDFVAAMIRMGDFRPLTGSDGEIRKYCGRPN